MLGTERILHLRHAVVSGVNFVLKVAAFALLDPKTHAIGTVPVLTLLLDGIADEVAGIKGRTIVAVEDLAHTLFFVRAGAARSQRYGRLPGTRRSALLRGSRLGGFGCRWLFLLRANRNTVRRAGVHRRRR